ncbi:hypothetical protein MMC25_002879 [Agyrium rufum]|nr:hypothetical protein [Agyrium rufum]
MLPLGLLTAAQGHPMLVELKNGETLNGHLVNCDTWMNLTLREVVQTSPEGDRFWRLPEVYVRGNNGYRCMIVELGKETNAGLFLGGVEQIKYLRVPDEIVDLVKDQQQNQPSSRGRGGSVQRGDHQNSRGGGGDGLRGGRGGGGSGGGGGGGNRGGRGRGRGRG